MRRAVFFVLALGACREPPPAAVAGGSDSQQTATATTTATATATATTTATATATTTATTTATANRPGPPAAAPLTLPPRPSEPRSGARACKVDDDCDFVPDDCTRCPPCEGKWRKAASKATVKKMLATRPTCPPISCPRCTYDPPPGDPRTPQGYIGDAVACDKGQCVVTTPALP